MKNVRYAARNTIYDIQPMAGKIIIDIERCKGCGLCVAVCPKSGIAISKKSNKSGYFPACPAPIVRTKSVSASITKRNTIDSSIGAAADSFDKLTTSCTGCAMCALVCPDAAIEVYCESKARRERRDKKVKPNLIKEKA